MENEFAWADRLTELIGKIGYIMKEHRVSNFKGNGGEPEDEWKIKVEFDYDFDKVEV